MGRIAATLALSRRVKAVAVALVLAVSAGCVSTDWQLFRSEPAPGEGVCQVVATWQNSVLFTPDPANQGKMSPGLAGRMYLFGPEISFPLVGDGSLLVGLFDETKGGSTLLDLWEIDAGTLKRLLKQDRIGWGYTVYLPWPRYSPEISKVRLKIEYRPAKGTPLYTENAVTLSPDNGNISVSHSPPTQMPVPK
jgi:hypothetical protein